MTTMSIETDTHAASTPTEVETELLAQADALATAAREHMKSFAIHLYLGAVFDVVAKANRYFANSEPWRLGKTDPARMQLVLFTTIETLRIAAILLQPVLPESPIVFIPFSRALRKAFTRLAELPLVEMPIRLSPGRPWATI